ncbi:AfsR/SARP family transcriptional regulator [Streptomyces sp. CMB-StM0423]|uniref:AfsR/SARP family transcriptional regulator n=1 Tax=Streptomyces sp. CMB-StM0423 TaxID=2059884 RepID=UPI001F462E09|nr:BTAD domain-containing putative transcriptional regulator [Streptomyces sp. CMB-StM0423]
MEFQILGPVELLVGERRVELGSDKERCLLAALALDVGRPLSIDTLAGRIWDGDPPVQARKNTHTYISRIRRHLRLADTDPPPQITRRAHTYALEVDPELVDWHRFKVLTAEASAAFDRGDDTRSALLLNRAAALWKGEPLAGLPGMWAARVRSALIEKGLAATVSRVTAELRLGRYADLVGELHELVDQHPADETVAGLLMLACYGSGRYPDALRAYQRIRGLLRGEFGSTPGAELDHLHQNILDRLPIAEILHGATAVRELPRTGHEQEPTGISGPAAPRNLPPQTPLVGRSEEMRALNAAIAVAAQDGSVVALEAISGMAGVGKTALALHAGHQLADHFPDGQLYLDLRAHSGPPDPLSPESALATLLRLLGIPAETIPVGLEERVALWRTMLTKLRALIVLDDASGPHQVRPLLPGVSPSLVIITSRRHLAGLPHARHVLLDVLPPDDAVELFREFAGPERTRDVEIVARIVRYCGYLPLAIELVANRLATRPSWTPTTLSKRLTQGTSRLREIRDGYQEIARAFELSYQTLTAAQQRAFRHLGLHPGPEFTADAGAALLGLPVDETEHVLDSLMSCHLLREPTPGRFTYHDLLREYADALAHSEDDRRTRDQALHRLISFSVANARQADELAHPRRLRLPAPGSDHSAEPWAAPPIDDATAWFAAERTSLLAVEAYARAHGAPDQAAQLADSLSGFLAEGCHWADAEMVHHNAVDHFRATGDQRALCQALLSLSGTHASTSKYPEAAEAGEEALRVARAEGDAMREAEALRGLGILQWHLGENHMALALNIAALRILEKSGTIWDRARCQNNIAIAQLALGEIDSARDHFQLALSGFKAAGDTWGIVRTLNNIGDLHKHSGEAELARETLETSLSLAESGGNAYVRATVRTNLADILAESGEIDQSLTMYAQAVQDFRSLGDRKSLANALNGLGDAHRRAGFSEEAAHHYRSSLDIARSIGSAHEEAHALRGLGMSELAARRLSDAGDHVKEAVGTARRTDDRAEEARALAVLADVRAAEGAADEARTALERAVELMRHLDPREADRMSQRLRELRRR